MAEATGDPYTSYFTAKEAETFECDLNNTFSGIGAELGKDTKGTIQVIAPIEGTPAFKAGVKAKGLIATNKRQIHCRYDSRRSGAEYSWPSRHKVKLQLVRGDQPVELTIIRETIQVPSVTYKTLANDQVTFGCRPLAMTLPAIREAATRLKRAVQRHRARYA